MPWSRLFLAGLLLGLGGCKALLSKGNPKTFEQDVQFLDHYTDVVLLGRAGDDSMLVVAPQWQGRVMTSTASGPQGRGLGWINYAIIREGEPQPHMNVYGGEDRFWLGPEAGQFGIFFEPGVPFDLEHWQVPAPIDSEAWAVTRRAEDVVTLRHEASVTNRAGATFEFTIDRTVRLLSDDDVLSLLGVLPVWRVKTVAFESENLLRNKSAREWTPDSGLLSIWIVGMFRPSPDAVVILPYLEGPVEELGPIVNDAYFGAVPPDRIDITPSAVLLRADGQLRSKVGLSPRRAKPVIGSYDAANKVLTIVAYDQPVGATRYVNSMWEEQADPFAGDVVNAYNDGTPEPGARPLGPFYELESSSPALALLPGEVAAHRHRTIHFVGEREDLDPIARRVLSVSLYQLPGAAPRGDDPAR